MTTLHQLGNGSQTVFQDGVVYQTKDLSSFKVSEENREVSDPHLSRLVKAIKKKNLLADFPILVTQDMTIIDGQHRYLAASELELPIYYRIATATEWADVGFANAAVKKWSLDDYLRYWCVKKVPAYLRLQEFLEDNPHMTLGIAVQLMSNVRLDRGVGGQRGQVEPWRRDFVAGTWEIVSYENAEALSQMLLDFKSYYAGYRRVQFANVMFELYKTAWYDHARMMHQLRTYGKTVEIRNATRKGDYMEMLEYAYNFNRRGDNRVTFPR